MKRSRCRATTVPILLQSLEGRQLFSACLITHLPIPVLSASHHAGAAATTISAIAGQDFSGKLATLPNLGTGTTAASIDWGDGTTSDATVIRSHGQVIISGEHTWAVAGQYTLTIAVFRTPPHAGGGPNTFFPVHLTDLTRIAVVSNAPAPTAGGGRFTATAGQPYSGPVGGFTFQNLDLILTPQINWGDGKSSTGQLSGGMLANGDYTVAGTHTYAAPGTYLVHVVVHSRVAGSPSTFPSGTVAEFDSVITVH